MERSEPYTSAITAAVEPGERRRRLLRWICAPFSWFLFLPYLVVSTLLFGLFAALVCPLSHRAAFHCGTAWAWLLCRLSLIRVHVVGRENAARGQPYIIMSNHQSHFDILAFYGHWRRQFRWVIKKELRNVPGLGWYCAAGRHIFIDRSSREGAIRSLQSARPLLEEGISVTLFPEGTRSQNGRLQPFKKGGFMVALALGLPILPISISGSRHVLPARAARLIPGTIQIRVHPPIDVMAYGPSERDRLMADVRAAIASGLVPWEQGDEDGAASSAAD